MDNGNISSHFSKIMEYKTSVEQIANETHAQIGHFQHEQSEIKSQMQIVMEDNKKLSNNLDHVYKTVNLESDADRHERIKLMSEALTIAQKQIESLKKDKADLNCINESAQRTIENMEKELDSYRKEFSKTSDINQLKRKYVTKVQALEKTIAQQSLDIAEQAKVIKVLHEHKLHSLNATEKLEKDLNERDTLVSKLRHELHEANHVQKEYEKSLSCTKALLDKTTTRESEAMIKVQEALAVAETALKEKLEAEKLVETYQESTQHLAGSIGSVMQKAAEKTEDEVLQMKQILNEKEQVLQKLENMLKDNEASFQNQYEAMCARYTRLEEQYKDALQEKAMINAELKTALLRKRQMELKWESTEGERLRQQQQEMEKHYTLQLQNYTHTNQQLKTKYKKTVDDLTERFEVSIRRLRDENSELKICIQNMQSAELTKVVDDIERESELELSKIDK